MWCSLFLGKRVFSHSVWCVHFFPVFFCHEILLPLFCMHDITWKTLNPRFNKERAFSVLCVCNSEREMPFEIHGTENPAVCKWVTTIHVQACCIISMKCDTLIVSIATMPVLLWKRPTNFEEKKNEGVATFYFIVKFLAVCLEAKRRDQTARFLVVKTWKK